MKSTFIKISVVSFLLGVYLYAKIQFSFNTLITAFLWTVFLLLLIRNRKISIIIGLGILFCFLGYFRYFISLPQVDPDSVHYYQNQDQQRVIQGIIIENPDRRRDKANYTIETRQIFLDDKWRKVNGRILVSTDLYPEFQYGDLVEIKGLLIEPAEFETFSYKNYLSLSNVYSVIYRPYLKKITPGNASLFFSIMFSLKDIFEEQINSIYPEPMASLSAGLLTGSRKGIPDDLSVNFNITGLTHIIAISGYNISLIIFFVSSFFSKSSRKLKVPIIIVFVILFTLFVGASPAVVRASIMGIISVLALWLGRQSQVLNALLLSAFVMVLINPNVLLYDVGFQLSFLATLGLILTGEKIKKFFSFLPETLGIREGFTMTLSAQIFALPVILLNFGRLSLISPVANLLVVPLIPLAMLFGFISVILSFINYSLGFVFTFPGWLVLKWIIETINLLAKLPFASVEIKWFSPFFFVGYYLFLILFSYFINPNLRNIINWIGRFNKNRLPVGNTKGV